VFPDQSEAVLPAIRSAYKAGRVVVPYRVSPGGKPGADYDYYIKTDFSYDGTLMAKWMVKALHGKGNVVYLGGPVSPESVVALGDFEQPEEAGTHVVGSLGTLDPDGTNDSLRRLRVFAGYAGWAPGQLDGELEQEAWIVDSAEPEDPFRTGDIWSEALERKGGRYRLMATMPADPSLN